jgi:hypothetical protein
MNSNSNSDAIACWHAESKALPKRRFRRGVDLCRPLSGVGSRGCAPACPRAARGLQWTQVGGENRLCVALHATRPATMGGCLPADAAVAQSGRLRGDGPRFARTVAPFGGQGVRADGSHTRLSHFALNSGERLPQRLRWSQTQEGLQGARGSGHFRTPARLARQSRRRAGESRWES